MKLVGCGAEDIVDGNLKIILGLMWTMILRYQINKQLKPAPAPAAVKNPDAPTPLQPVHVVEEKPTDAQKELLAWVQRQLKGYPVTVNDFTKSWISGKPLAALVQALKKTAIDYDAVQGKTPLELNQTAIDAADSELGIPKIVDAEDVATKPEQLSMMTYISYFRDYQIEHANDAPEEVIAEPEPVKKIEVDPAKTMIVDFPQVVDANKPVNFVIKPRDGQGNPVPDVDKSVVKIAFSGPEDNITASVKDDNGDFQVSFVPTAAGKYKAFVTVDGEPLKDSPVNFLVRGDADPAKSELMNNDLLMGVTKVHSPATFTVKMNDAAGTPVGKGGEKVNVAVISKNKDVTPKCNVKVTDNNDGTYDVQFVPADVGRHNIKVIVDKKGEVKGSPFGIDVLSDISPSQCAVIKLEPQAKADTPQEFTIQAKNDKGEPINRGGENFLVSIRAPDDKVTRAPVTDNMDGTYTVNYNLTKPGAHVFNVTLDDEPIAGSPSTVSVIAAASPQHSMAKGTGLLPGNVKVDFPAEFTIQAKDRSGADIKTGGDDFQVVIVQDDQNNLDGVTLEDNNDGTYAVKYTPTKPGALSIRVTLNGSGIHGSPYTVFPETVPYAPNCKVVASPDKGKNLAKFEVKLYDKFGKYVPKGKAKVTATMTGEDGSVFFVPVYDIGNGQYTVKNVAGLAPGKYKVRINMDGHIIDSFNVEVVPEIYGPNCTCQGPGLEGADLYSGENIPCVFSVHARDMKGNPVAPPNLKPNKKGDMKKLLQRIQDFRAIADDDPEENKGKKKKKDNTEDDGADEPAEPVKAELPKQSFENYYYDFPQQVSDEFSDMYNPLYESVYLDNLKTSPKDVPFQVEVANADTSKKLDPTILYGDDGEYIVIYTPTQAGVHNVNVSFDGKNVDKSPYKVPVTNGIDPKKTLVTGPGVEKAYQDMPAYFMIKPRDKKGNPIKVGGANFKVSIKDPMAKQLTGLIMVDDMGNGDYQVCYQPKQIGNHLVEVKYNGKKVTATPINVFVHDASKAPDANKSDLFNFKPKGRVYVPNKFNVKLKNANGDEVKSGGDDLLVHIVGPIPASPDSAVSPASADNDNKEPVEKHPEAEKYLAEVANASKSPKQENFIAKPLAPSHGIKPNLKHNYVFPAQEFGTVIPKVTDTQTGLYDVEFTCDEPGDYLVDVRVGNEPLNNAPYAIKITAAVRGIEISDYTFTIRTPAPSFADKDFDVTIVNDDNGSDKYSGVARKMRDDKFHVLYDPSPENVQTGLYNIQAQWKDKDIRGSPFKQTFIKK